MGDIGTRIPFGRKGQGPKVLWSLPNERWLHKLVVQRSMILQLQENVLGRLHGDLIMPTHRPFENNLHHIVRDMLDNGYDYWVSFDADNPPRANPFDLVFEDKDIIGCPTPVWHWRGLDVEKPGTAPIYWNAYKYVPSEDAYTAATPAPGKIVEVDAIGTGCFVMARRVFEHRLLQKGCFRRKTLKDGRVDKGNDISFCERARTVGFKVWAAWTHPCHHFHEIDLSEASQAMNHWKDGMDNA